MLATWRYTFRRMLIPTICWSATMFGMAALVILAFDYMIQKNRQLLIDLVAAMPPMLQAMVGDAQQFVTPKGFLDAKFFAQSGLFLGIYAVFVGSGLLATDEEKGRLDLLAAYPVSRRRLFCERVLAMSTSLALIIMAAWLGLVASLPLTSLEIAPMRLALSCLTLFAVTTLFAAIALLLSLLLPSRLSAAGAAGMLLFVSFLIAMFAPGVDFVRPLHNLLPLRFYQGGQAMEHFDFAAFGTLIVLSIAALFGAGWRFERRDIRVMGEAVFKSKRTARDLVVCAVIYCLIVGPVAFWKPYEPPGKTSPADFLKKPPPALMDVEQ